MSAQQRLEGAYAAIVEADATLAIEGQVGSSPARHQLRLAKDCLVEPELRYAIYDYKVDRGDGGLTPKFAEMTYVKVDAHTDRIVNYKPLRRKWVDWPIVGAVLVWLADWGSTRDQP